MLRHESRVEPASYDAQSAKSPDSKEQTQAERRQKLNDWFSIAYKELERRASFIRRYHPNAAIGTETLVHEVWLKLATSPGAIPDSKLHFKRTAAKAMRHIVSSEARRHSSGKAGGAVVFVTLDESIGAPIDTLQDFLALDAALDMLALAEPRQAEMVEMRYYGGLTNSEIATVLGVTERTVERDWRSARAWLKKEMSKSH